MRMYREGDEDQIRELRGLTLSGEKDNDWWQWFYKDNPAGPALIWLAEMDQKIVGHAAHVPVRMKVGDTELIGALGVDSMTHPDYQRQGILRKLQEKITESSIENDYCFSVGTCLSHIMSIYERLPITEICEQHLLMKVTSWGQLFKKRFRLPYFLGSIFGSIWEFITYRLPRKKSDDIEVDQIYSFEDNVNTFWQKASAQKEIMVVKDKEYLNWRYFDKPGEDYRVFLAKSGVDVVGYIVLKLGKINPTRGLIIDILTLPNDNSATEALVRKALEYFIENGILIISCFMLPDTQYYPILKKMGFIRRSSDLHFDIDIYNCTLSKEFVTNPNNWYFVRGDTDSD